MKTDSSIKEFRLTPEQYTQQLLAYGDPNPQATREKVFDARPRFTPDGIQGSAAFDCGGCYQIRTRELRITLSPRFSKEDLAGIAVLAEATYHPEAEEPYIALLSGRGEVQLNEDGDAWYFLWTTRPSEGIVLDEAKELGSIPEGRNLPAIAAWLVEQARKFQDR